VLILQTKSKPGTKRHSCAHKLEHACGQDEMRNFHHALKTLCHYVIFNPV
jgi:hypothetical protein